jgi:carbon storage regulator
MLLLSRRTGETIQIGDDITVTVLTIKGYPVPIGISAPNEIKILREELISSKKCHQRPNAIQTRTIC